MGKLSTQRIIEALTATAADTEHQQPQAIIKGVPSVTKPQQSNIIQGMPKDTSTQGVIMGIPTKNKKQ